MAADPWKIDRLALAGYRGRLGVAAREPIREALTELHEAHVRSFTFDDIDVLLGQRPSVGLAVPDGAPATSNKVLPVGGVPTISTESGELARYVSAHNPCRKVLTRR